MKTTAKFTFDKVRFDQDTDAHLVVSLDAPMLKWEEKRPPVAIIPVVDVSGSMNGEKLDYAKKSLLKMVDHLKPGDYCGLALFENVAHLISPLIKITPEAKESLRKLIGDIHIMGGTNFSAGLMLGLDMASKADIPATTVVRVIMFTDGQPTHGVVHADGIKEILVANRGNASVSAFGYGTDCNHDLLGDMSKSGSGNYAFIAKPEDAMAAFGKELGGLLSTYAQDIVIDVSPNNGHKIVEVVSDVDVEDKDGKVKIRLGDILSEEKRSVVIKMKLAKQKQALPRAMNAVDVKVSYTVIEEGKKKACESAVKAKVQFVKDTEAQAKPTSDLDAVVGLAELAQKQVEAEAMAKKGQYAQAGSLLQQFAAATEGRGLSGLNLAANKLSVSYGSQVSYNSSAGYRRSTKGYADRAYSVSLGDEEATSDMAAVFEVSGDSMSNSVQSNTTEAFTGNKGTGG